MSKKDSVIKTFVVAGALSIVCAIAVSTAAVKLRPIQTKNQSLDRKKNILAAANLLSADKSVDEIFAEKIKPRLVEIDSGEYSDRFDPLKYDQRKAASDPKLSQKIPPEQDIAKIKRQAKLSTVYEVYEGGELTKVILPIHGKGLWSTLYGFIALKANTDDIVGLGFYEHGETPGLGGEVDNPNWKEQWQGKEVYDEQGDLAITVLKGKVNPSDPDAVHKIDGLSGSTLTTNGVRNLVRFWLGPQGFGPYLENLRQRGNLNG
jgi:Na+-transporting NADH:ubiquinone oxidoreductase subunit C